MKIKANHLILPAIALVALASSTPLVAGPFSTAASSASTEISSVAKVAGTVLGIVTTVISGCIVAWKASHSEPFTKELVFGIIGIIIAGVAVVS